MMVAGTVVAHSDALRVEVFTRVGNAPVCVLTDAHKFDESTVDMYTSSRKLRTRTTVDGVEHG